MKNILALSSISIPYLRRRGGRERERGRKGEEGAETGKKERRRQGGRERGREGKAHTRINTSIHKLLCVFSKRKYVYMYHIT